MFESVRVIGRGVPRAIVVGQFDGEGLDRTTLGHDVGGVMHAATDRTECTGEAGRLAECYPPKGPARVIIVGLGHRGSFDPGVLRTALAAAGRRLALTRDGRVLVDLRGPITAAKADAERCGVAAGEALGLLSWTCDQFRGTSSQAPKRDALELLIPEGMTRFTAGLRHGLELAQGANLARTLSETPPNIATTTYIAQQARALARRTGMRCDVIRGQQLEKERMVGLINVGRASQHPPCLVRLEYRPAKARGKPVVLIGKTMTYDSGGLSLKINNGMVGMKRDKDGGCAVLGAMSIIASHIKPRRPVVALLACAENAISDNAYRPDDVIRYRNGVTVEVTNTDAEGRLVLADALCWACEKESPAAIVDVATLTGGVVVALGSTYAGLWCEDDALRARIERASAACGERVWRLPLVPEYREMMKSPVADILNSNPNRKAHPIQGAAFLSYFVADGVPWAHIDIAGVHAVEGDAGPFVKGPTGFGARLLANLVDGD